MPYFVYMLLCRDGTYYTGCTADLASRLIHHENGESITAYTYSRRPVKLVWAGEFTRLDEALSFERQVKGWSRKKKAALIEEDWDKIHAIVKEERSRREKKNCP